jgi:hypothetical protein
MAKFNFFSAKGEIFPKWMTDPVIWHQDSAQVRVPRKLYTKHVIDFAFRPHSRWVNISGTRTRFIEKQCHAHDYSICMLD